MKSRSINRWITRCFIIILAFSMIASAVANLYEAYVSTIERGGELVAACAGNVSNLLNHQWSLFDLTEKRGVLAAEAHKVFSQLCESYQLDFIDIYGYSIRPVILLLFLHIVCPKKPSRADRPSGHIVVQTFGNFEIFVDGETLREAGI